MKRIDYSTRVYKNPANKRKRGGGKKKYYYISTIIVFSISLSYIIFFSPAFEIKNIEILGNTIDKDKLSSLLSSKNLLLLNIDALKNSFLNTESRKITSIKKKFPNTLSIELKEVKPEVVWVTQNKGYLMDAEGKIYSEITGEDVEKNNINNYNILRHKYIYNTVPIIYDKNNSLVNINKYILNEKNIRFIKEIYSNINIDIDYYELSLNDYSLEALTSKGWKIILSLEDSAQDQLDRLSVILKNEDTVGKIVDYIDLRYGDKV